MAIDEALDCRWAGGFANGVCHVNRVKVRMRDETVDGFQPDMVGIDVVGFLPVKGFDGSVRGRAGCRWFGANGRVLAIGFIPDRNNFGAVLSGQNAGLQLGTGLTGKSVPYPERIFFEGQSLRHKAATSQFRAYSNTRARNPISSAQLFENSAPGPLKAQAC